MFIAIVMTVVDPTFGPTEVVYLFLISLIPGAIIGSLIAFKVEMTSMPQTVAAFHSFVGLAAVLVGVANYLGPNNEGQMIHLIETFIGVFIGGLTFTGSIVAFGKLQGVISGNPLVLCGWGRHVLNLMLVLGSIVLGVFFCGSDGTDGQVYLYIMVRSLGPLSLFLFSLSSLCVSLSLDRSLCRTALTGRVLSTDWPVIHPWMAHGCVNWRC